jgi:hypothetical protein
MNEKRDWTLSPSDFAFLWEECKRCYYLKITRHFRRPRSVMPKIFTTIDAKMKKYFSAKGTDSISPLLPTGVIDTNVSWVQSVPLSIPGHTSTCTIKGKLDTVLRFDGGTYAVVDFKTSETRSRHIPLYSRQLHAYALALENAAPEKLSLSPVIKLGLVVFDPRTFSRGNDGSASLVGPLKWIEISRDDPTFLIFLQDVLDVLERPVPPEASPNCEWCQYRDRGRSTGL